MEQETPNPTHTLRSPPDLLPLLWHLADLAHVSVTALGAALHLAVTSVEVQPEDADISFNAG